MSAEKAHPPTKSMKSRRELRVITNQDQRGMGNS